MIALPVLTSEMVTSLREKVGEAPVDFCFGCHQTGELCGCLSFVSARLLLAVLETAQLPGLSRAIAERWRQINVEGFTPARDQQYTDGQLALAAVAYASPRALYVVPEVTSLHSMVLRDPWPFPPKFDRRIPLGSHLHNEQLAPFRRIELLEKAAALIAAEIDRLSALSQ